MDGFVLILSILWSVTTGGPTGGAAGNYTTATFADAQACMKAGEVARAMVYKQFAPAAKKPSVNFACVPQSSPKK
jgi:hypothetical protein